MLCTQVAKLAFLSNFIISVKSVSFCFIYFLDDLRGFSSVWIIEFSTVLYTCPLTFPLLLPRFCLLLHRKMCEKAFPFHPFSSQK